MSCWIAATAVERDAERVAAEQPELWREVRRFNLPVKLALAAADRVVGSLAQPRDTWLFSLAPCRPGSPELRAISRELDAGVERGSCSQLRVNPVYTLHAIDNLALSALSIRLENQAPCVCLGGAAGQAFAALEQAMDELTWASDAAGTGMGPPSGAEPAAGGAGAHSSSTAGEVLLFGGDQGDAAWHGEANDPEACGVAIVMTTRPTRVRLIAVERKPLDRPNGKTGGPRPNGEAPIAHAVAGLARWFDALAAAPPGVHRYVVPVRDGDGIDHIELVTEVMA